MVRAAKIFSVLGESKDASFHNFQHGLAASLCCNEKWQIQHGQHCGCLYVWKHLRILCPKNTTSIPITLPWKYNPPPRGGNINYSIHMQKLCFLYDEKAVPASRSKVQEDKRKWNLPHSGKRLLFIIRRKSLTLKPIFTQGISEKLLKTGNTNLLLGTHLCGV